MAATWQRQWQQVIPFFAYPPEVCKIIYTTNAIESLHMQLHKIAKNLGHFPTDDAARKLLFPALRHIEKGGKLAPIPCKQAANQFAIPFGEQLANPALFAKDYLFQISFSARQRGLRYRFLPRRIQQVVRIPFCPFRLRVKHIDPFHMKIGSGNLESGQLIALRRNGTVSRSAPAKRSKMD